MIRPELVPRDDIVRGVEPRARRDSCGAVVLEGVRQNRLWALTPSVAGEGLHVSQGPGWECTLGARCKGTPVVDPRCVPRLHLYGLHAPSPQPCLLEAAGVIRMSV